MLAPIVSHSPSPARRRQPTAQPAALLLTLTHPSPVTTYSHPRVSPMTPPDPITPLWHPKNAHSATSDTQHNAPAPITLTPHAAPTTPRPRHRIAPSKMRNPMTTFCALPPIASYIGPSPTPTPSPPRRLVVPSWFSSILPGLAQLSHTRGVYLPILINRTCPFVNFLNEVMP